MAEWPKEIVFHLVKQEDCFNCFMETLALAGLRMMNYYVSWKCCLMLWSLRLWHCLPELWARRGITSSLDKSVICAQLNTFLMLPDCSLSRYDWSSHLWLTWLGILFIWWSGHLSFISVTMDVHVLGCPFCCAGWPGQSCILRYPFQLLLSIIQLRELTKNEAANVNLSWRVGFPWQSLALLRNLKQFTKNECVTSQRSGRSCFYCIRVGRQKHWKVK